VLQCAGVFGKLLEIGVGSEDLRQFLLARAGVYDVDQSIRTFVRERPEQHPVDNAEDGRIRPNAQRQRYQHDGRESG
jgi:hypothetical protein